MKIKKSALFISLLSVFSLLAFMSFNINAKNSDSKKCDLNHNHAENCKGCEKYSAIEEHKYTGIELPLKNKEDFPDIKIKIDEKLLETYRKLNSLDRKELKSVLAASCPYCKNGKLVKTRSEKSNFAATGKQRKCTHGYFVGYDLEFERACFDEYKCDSCNFSYIDKWTDTMWECRGSNQ